MAAKNPRLTIVLEQETYDILRRVSAVNGESMSSIVRELVEMMQPGLESIASLGEAYIRASSSQKAAVARGVERFSTAMAPQLVGNIDDVIAGMEHLERIAKIIEPPHETTPAV